MDDSNFGIEDNKGNWIPNKKISYAPLFNWPVKPMSILKWVFGFPGFFLPWNIFYIILTILVWFYLTPSLETMLKLELEWIIIIYLRNFFLTLFIYGTWHLWFYIWRKQEKNFKYNKNWQSKNSKNFLFKNQTYDNVFWSLASGVTIWTIYEVLFLWLYSNGNIKILNFFENPYIFILVFLLIPLIHELGFYFTHRILHYKFLYKIAHKIHHKNINPGPWSGLSMHPIEHIMYFGIVLILLLFPTHPLHTLNLLIRLGISPAEGHSGFDRVVINKKKSFNASFYAHYLHHKYFEVNYADGIFPLDKLFGSFHDGTNDGNKILKERRKKSSINLL